MFTSNLSFHRWVLGAPSQPFKNCRYRKNKCQVLLYILNWQKHVGEGGAFLEQIQRRRSKGSTGRGDVVSLLSQSQDHTVLRENHFEKNIYDLMLDKQQFLFFSDLIEEINSLSN